MDTLNTILCALGHAAFAALGWLSPLGALLAISAVFGVLMTIAFRYTSNQRALRRVADQTRANLLAIRLFRDDLGVTVRAQGALLKATGLRLWHSLRPMAILIVPFFFVLVQIAMRYESRAPSVGEPIHVVVKTTADAFERLAATLTLAAPPGVTVEVMPDGRGFPDPERLNLEWRLRAERAVAGSLRWQHPGGTIEKSLVVPAAAADLPVVSSVRPGAHDWWGRLLHPAEAALRTETGVQQITIQVEPRDTPVLGWNMPWWLTFLVVSIVVALIVRPFLGVQF